MSAYEELRARVRRDLKPSDVIEQFWVREVVDLMFEILRWRRLRTTYLEAAISRKRDRALDVLVEAELNRLAPDLFPKEERRGVVNWDLKRELDERKEKFKQDPAVARQLRKIRESAEPDLDMEVLTAQVFVRKLKQIESIDQLTTIAERRLDMILREIDRRRAPFAQVVRETIHEVEGAEIKTIEPKKNIPRYRLTKNVA